MSDPPRRALKCSSCSPSISQVGPYRPQGPRGPSGPSPNPSAWTSAVWATLTRIRIHSSSSSRRLLAPGTQRPLQTALRTNTLLCNIWTASCLMQLQPQVGKDCPQCWNILLKCFKVPYDTFCHIVTSLSRLQRNILTGSVIQNYPELKTLQRI